MIDDSLLLGFLDDAPTPASEQPLSVSSCREFSEDPHHFYLRRIAGHEEPYALSQLQGSAVHAGLEAFDRAEGDPLEAAVRACGDYLAGHWEEVVDRTVRINRRDPSQPAGRQSVAVTLDEVRAESARLLEWAGALFLRGDPRYTPLSLPGPEPENEVTLGALARRRGMPHAEVTFLDRRTGELRPGVVAVIAGVPVHGYVDRVVTWADGSPALIDHKVVSHVVPFWGEQRRRYEPSYDPAADFQLDVYSVASDIPRAGFQFFLKQPQYVPPDGVLHPAWLDEPRWRRRRAVDGLLPLARAGEEEGRLRWAMVWRPAPQDHPSAPDGFRRERIYPRCARQLRRAAELITEGVLLLAHGAEPEIAFPPGRASRIGRKLCPYCTFRGDPCRVPQTHRTDAELFRLAQIADERRARREALCREIPAIAERRALWAAEPAARQRPE